MIGLAHRGHSSPSALTPSFMLVAFVKFVDKLFVPVDATVVVPFAVDELRCAGCGWLEQPPQESQDHLFLPREGKKCFSHRDCSCNRYRGAAILRNRI